MISCKNNSRGEPFRASIFGQRGVSLIDAMIALVIFSVGLLALASLQTVSKQSNYEALQRSYAASMAYDLLERIRMNSSDTSARSAYVVSNITIDAEIAGVTDCAAAGANCDNVALAKWDLENWRQLLNGSNEKIDVNEVGGLTDPVACLETVAVADPPGGVQLGLTIVWRGQVSITDNNSGNACGNARYGANNEYRRILVINTYINQ